MNAYPPAGESDRAGAAVASARTPFADLTPDAVLDSAEELGLQPDGRLFALNSYENRVYRVGRLDAEPVVLKFYRAGRWSDQQILEEHAFAEELAQQEILVAAPLRLAGLTLHHQRSLRLAAFPLCAGTSPELDHAGARELLGRTLARIHAVGALRAFQYRPSLQGEQLGRRARASLLRSRLLPQHMRDRYAEVSATLLEGIDNAFELAGGLQRVRLHGDGHLGNILWQARGPLLVDLDDCVNGPRMQDLWMFLSGNADEQGHQWQQLMEGYRQFGSVDYRELGLIEALRSVRMLNHAAWVAERWDDPAFPRAFPWAGEVRFWEGYVGDLIEQCRVMQEPPLLQSLL